MLLGKISYCMPNILENDDLMIAYKIPILDVVKCAWISLPGHLFFILAFWYYHCAKFFKWAVSIEICVWSVFSISVPGQEKIQVTILLLILSWIYSGPVPGPISLPSRSCFYFDPTPVLALILDGLYPYLGFDENLTKGILLTIKLC
jgi:hypothetical protein